MRHPVELKGKPASDGIFAGPVFFLSSAEAERRASGDPEVERQAFDEAIAMAIAGLAALTETAEGEAAEMLSFQVALLEDGAAVLKGPPDRLKGRLLGPYDLFVQANKARGPFLIELII